jgi:hypothetical protein
MTSTFYRYTRLTTMLALLVTAAACSSDSNPAGSDGSSNNSGGSNGSSSVTNCTTQSNPCMTALIDGTAFTSITTASGIGSYSGGLLAAGGGDANYSLAFALFASNTGSYTIPGNGVNLGKNAILSSARSAASWSASQAGGSGTVTVTSLTSTTVAGTFSFTVIPTAGTGATGNHSITNGTFLVRF